MYFSLDILFEMIINLLPYIKNTLYIAIVGFIFALLIAIFISIIMYFKIPFLRQIFTIYISFFRSTPVLSQLFVVFYGFPQIFEQLRGVAPMYFLIAVLALSQASFISETLRGALNSINKGQYEAGLSCGMTKTELMFEIIFPQAVRVAFPGLSNTFIGMIKGTSVGFTIGVIELMSRAKLAGMRNFRIMESYVAVSLIYWGIVLILSQFQKVIEKKLNTPYLEV